MLLSFFKKHKLICDIIGPRYLVIVWVLTGRFMFCCHFLGRKYPFSLWAAKYCSQELILWFCYKDRDYLIYCLFHLSILLSLAIMLAFLSSK